MGKCVKGIELKLISELMRNSRRSDRELAKAVGVSQPTVSRAIKRLENEGYVREYTILPDFAKMGFQIMSVVLVKMKGEVDQDKIEELRKKLRGDEKKDPSSILMAVNGLGCGADRLCILLSEDYASYSRYIDRIKQYPLLNVHEVQSFTIDLMDKTHFVPLTLSHLSAYLEKKLSEERKREN